MLTSGQSIADGYSTLTAFGVVGEVLKGSAVPEFFKVDESSGC
jgi:hypothetical protein